VKDRFAELRRAHEETVLGGPGKTASALRRALADGGADVPDDLRALVDKIERAPWSVTDDDVAALKKARSEDEVFEMIVATAMGAAMRRFRAATKALEETEDA
jgi:hypothetical protein